MFVDFTITISICFIYHLLRKKLIRFPIRLCDGSNNHLIQIPMWRNWWKTTLSEKIYCIFICRNVSLNGGPQKELHVNKVLPKTGLFYPWFYKVQSATIPKRFKTRHYLKTRLHDLTCNSSSVKFSPSSFETLFKFLKEIFPVSSSSNNLKAFAISSLESFSLWNSSKDGSIYYLSLGWAIFIEAKTFYKYDIY